MSLKIQSTSERHVYPGSEQASPSQLPANQSQNGFSDQTKLPAEEICFRFIQNVGANNIYYKFGGACNKNDFNGILAPSGVLDANGFGQGAQLDCSAHRQLVSLYSPAGSWYATTLLLRNDIGKNNSGSYLISP